jgi:hypothetical protein
MGVCSHDGCKTRPIYNKEGEKKALYCAKHKKEGMVNVKDKTCSHDGCKTRPIYNKEGEKKALYCAKHKKEGMVNVKDKTCSHDGCKTQPIYNKEGEKKALYCAKHKKEGMVNIKDKTCSHDGCKTHPYYNKEGEKKALYCSKHKKDGMVDVINKTCKSDWCLTRSGNKYKGYCLYCYINLFPGLPVSRNYKTKESAVVNYIKEKFPEKDWVADKQISNGCSRKRPDLLLDLGYQVIIIEVDENQHISYDCSCENKRMMELSQDIGHRPIVLIRFNPDTYIKNGSKISSCWGINGNGICAVKKTKKIEWEQRLLTLENQIDCWVCPSNKTNKTVEVIQLFYDI